MGAAKESKENESEASAGFDEERNAVCENVCHFVLEATYLNQDWYCNNDKVDVLTKLALKYGTFIQRNENEIFEQLSIFVYQKKKEQLKSLFEISKAKMKCAVNKVKCVLKKIDIRNVTEQNNTLYAAAAYVTELVKDNKRPKTKKEPLWNGQLEGKLKELSQDLDIVNN